jgi:hypothetical protein
MYPVEQLLRRRVYWWLLDVSVKVTEVLFDSRDIASVAEKSYVSVAQIASELKKTCFSERISIPVECRERLAEEWVALRDKGIGLRRLDKNAHLIESPIEHYDADLRALVGHQPILLSHVIGMGMVKTGMSDNFCKWRYIEVINKGGLLLSSGNYNEAHCTVVCK